MAREFEGVLPPTITPFNEKFEIDEEGLREDVDFWIEEGVAGIIPCGSTGEFASLLHEERRRLIDIVIDQTNGRVPVIPGTGANGTKETIILSKYAEDTGADGVMIVPPYYCKPDDDEIYEHYREVANAINIPIVLYNNPFTSGVDVKPTLLAKMFEEGIISYVKESSGDVRRVRKILQLSNGKLKVFCGSDDLMLESFLLGATGWVAGIANFMPRLSSELFQHCVKVWNLQKAKELNAKILPIGEMSENSGKFVQVCKTGMELIGKRAGLPRKPLSPLSEKERKRLKELLENIGLIK